MARPSSIRKRALHRRQIGPASGLGVADRLQVAGGLGLAVRLHVTGAHPRRQRQPCAPRLADPRRSHVLQADTAGADRGSGRIAH